MQRVFAENSHALKVCLSGRREAGRDLLFLFSCKVTEGAGSRPDSFVLFSEHDDDDDDDVDDVKITMKNAKYVIDTEYVAEEN